MHEEEILKVNTIAVVGISADPNSESQRVSLYLQDNGKRMIPINPAAKEILGEKAYPSLSALPEKLKQKVEMVNIFGPQENLAAIVDEAIALKKNYGTLRIIWMQLGLENHELARKAEKAGIAVVMNQCAMGQHARLLFSSNRSYFG